MRLITIIFKQKLPSVIKNGKTSVKNSMMQRLRKKMMEIYCEKYVTNLMKWKNKLKTLMKQIYYQKTKKQIYKQM